MKRRVTDWPHYRPADAVPEALSTEQLAGIGSVALAYNEAERMLDWILFAAYCTSAGVTMPFWTEITARMGGIDGKVEAINRSAEYWLMDKALVQQVSDAMSAFIQFKGYRDAVIHARIVDAKAGIFARVQRRAQIIEVILSTDALEGLAQRLGILRNELLAVSHIIHGARWDNLNEQGLQWHSKPQPGRWLPDGIVQFQRYRKQRLSLPPLPTFPQSPPDPLGTGAS